MGIFDSYLKNMMKPGKGVNEPVPDRGAKRYWHLLKTHFTKLIGVNLLFAAALLAPVYLVYATYLYIGSWAFVFLLLWVMAPAARAGITRVMIKLARDGNCFFWNEFVLEFKSDFFKRLFASLTIAFLPVAMWVLTMYTGHIIGFGAAVGFTALAYVMFSYFFVMLTITDLPVGTCVKNAFLLVAIEWKASLLIFVVSGGTLFLCFSFIDYAIPLICTVVFSFLWLFEALMVNQVLKKRILSPENKDDAGSNPLAQREPEPERSGEDDEAQKYF